jgi:hypothetical protein
MQKLYSTAKEGLKGSVEAFKELFIVQKSAVRGLEVFLEALSVLVEAKEKL